MTLQKRAILFGISAAFVVLASPRHASAQPAADQSRVPVLVELFTSEGCSDCPPADRLLEELDAKQAVPGAQVVALSEHVTYWNHLGWSDPFSLPEMDWRQQQYATRFSLDSTYTPQMVIDGAAQLVGNNSTGVVQAIAKAASIPKKQLALADARWDNGTALFTINGAADSSTRLVAVLAADATHSEVARGENAGRTLHHVAVARVLKEFGPVVDGKQLRLPGGSLSHGKESSGSVRLVVFLVDHKSGHVLAAAEQTIGR